MLKVPTEESIYFILDALDECPDTFGLSSSREKVLDLVEKLVRFHLPNLRLCVTSRPEIDIRNVLEPLTSTSNRISLHDEEGQKKDIADYVRSVVYSDRKMTKWRKSDKELVIETLSGRANGM
jgi:NACHT domain